MKIHKMCIRDRFDTAGTLMGVAHRANLVDEDGKIHNLSKALKADSTSSVVGAMVGCPPVTSYVESASGVAAGGRTGLTAVTVGILFLAAMFFAPLAGMIPAYATAGALIYVAMLMMSGMAHIDWKDHTDTIPAIVTAVSYTHLDVYKRQVISNTNPRKSWPPCSVPA